MCEGYSERFISFDQLFSDVFLHLSTIFEKEKSSLIAALAVFTLDSFIKSFPAFRQPKMLDFNDELGILVGFS